MRPKTSAMLVAVWALLQSSHPGDELFAVDFNDRAVLTLPARQPFTNDPRELETALRAVRAQGQTALYDGVAEGLEHLRRGRAERRVLVIVSDGGDNASRHTYAQIRTRARQSNVVIYAIGLMGIGSAQDEDARLLKRLCQDTGGTAYFPRTTSDLASESMQVARTIRQQYTLGFAPGARKDGKRFRKIEVKVTASGRGRLHVRTRSGYAVPSDRP